VTPKLDGVLALRTSWCQPDEDVLLCASSSRAGIGFDVAGLDWFGRPDRGPGGKALRALGTATAAVAAGGPREQGQSAPSLVVFGSAPAFADLPDTASLWCVLTPRRLAWVRTVEEPPEPEAEGSFFAQVKGFAKNARDSLAGRSPYPAHRPIETVDVVPVVEAPRGMIASVVTAERKLPYDYSTRTVHVLRVALADGSGVEFVGGHEPEHARRLLDMANGQR
jgi:hypothetical protein